MQKLTELMGKKKKIYEECALCKEDKFLLNSHIIPDFHEKKFTKLAEKSNNRKLVNVGREGVIPRKSGGLRQHLLCGVCEQKLSKAERLASKVLYHNAGSWKNIYPRIYICDDVDFKLFRFYCLSVLWRISVSSHKDLEGIKLGVQKEEELRLALLSNDDLLNEYFFRFHRLTNVGINFSSNVFYLPRRDEEGLALVHNNIIMECVWGGWNSEDQWASDLLKNENKLIISGSGFTEHPISKKIFQYAEIFHHEGSGEKEEKLVNA